jgi:EAL domain-containing protein (putative c-di-GMP-specific phosphodiesterase class I)
MPNRFRGLVASGDDEFREELVEVAIGFGFSIHAIRSADELPDLLQGHEFNWLFLDIALGIEQCAWIIDIFSGNPHPRIILMGVSKAQELEDVRHRARHANIDLIGSLTKPLSSAALATVLASLGAREFDVHDFRLAVRDLGAIPTNEIVIHYQPIVSMKNRMVSAVEALVRWQHAQYGLLSPDLFVSHAERSGAIGPLTWEVLRRALDQHVEWRNEGTTLPVSVNVSTLSLTSLQMTERILDLLRERACDPSFLTLEITESEKAPEPPLARTVLTTLRDAGVAVSMDDYGVGYSTMERLKYYPFSGLKLDRRLVASLASDHEVESNERSNVEMLVASAHNDGMSVTGEGIETEAQWKAMAELGCDFGQGFLIARPMRAAEILRWIKAARGAG